MTRFSRRGHWRTSALGNTYWVDDHDVSRDDWDRADGINHVEYADAERRLGTVRADHGATSTYVIPNAVCPVCGVLVYFYQNQHGSRVFFDELGKPWPKHPCTDIEAYRQDVATGVVSEEISPVCRSKDEVARVEEWLLRIRSDPQQRFENKYSVSPWAAYRVIKRLKARKRSLLVLDAVDNQKAHRIFLTGESVPKVVKPGLLVFYYRNWISYLDLTTIQPEDLELQRLKGPAAFVDHLVGTA